jgi:hypothetical protein
MKLTPAYKEKDFIYLFIWFLLVQVNLYGSIFSLVLFHIYALSSHYALYKSTHRVK